MDANRTAPQYELKDDLARYCLPQAHRDPNRKLAWVNSICILFLLIGLLGGQAIFIPVKALPPVETVVPAIIEPVPPPPQTAQEPEQNQEQKPASAQVVVVTPDAPSINFSVPTIGNLLVPNAVATAPPLNPMQAPAPLENVPTALKTTGTGGARPDPPYPKIAEQTGEQGAVTLRLTADDAGNILSAEVKQSSGYPILDRSAIDFVKRHWTVPTGHGNKLYEVTITYRLSLNNF